MSVRYVCRFFGTGFVDCRACGAYGFSSPKGFCNSLYIAMRISLGFFGFNSLSGVCTYPSVVFLLVAYPLGFSC